MCKHHCEPQRNTIPRTAPPCHPWFTNQTHTMPYISAQTEEQKKTFSGEVHPYSGVCLFTCVALCHPRQQTGTAERVAPAWTQPRAAHVVVGLQTKNQRRGLHPRRGPVSPRTTSEAGGGWRQLHCLGRHADVNASWWCLHATCVATTMCHCRQVPGRARAYSLQRSSQRLCVVQTAAVRPARGVPVARARWVCARGTSTGSPGHVSAAHDCVLHPRAACVLWHAVVLAPSRAAVRDGARVRLGRVSPWAGAQWNEFGCAPCGAAGLLLGACCAAEKARTRTQDGASFECETVAAARRWRLRETVAAPVLVTAMEMVAVVRWQCWRNVRVTATTPH